MHALHFCKVMHGSLFLLKLKRCHSACSCSSAAILHLNAHSQWHCLLPLHCTYMHAGHEAGTMMPLVWHVCHSARYDCDPALFSMAITPPGMIVILPLVWHVCHSARYDCDPALFGMATTLPGMIVILPLVWHDYRSVRYDCDPAIGVARLSLCQVWSWSCHCSSILYTCACYCIHVPDLVSIVCDSVYVTTKRHDQNY